jgi:hypothetical protein
MAFDNSISKSWLTGSVLRNKGEKEEIQKTLKENGSLSDYLKDLKKNPPERYKEEELGNFYDAFK